MLDPPPDTSPQEIVARATELAAVDEFLDGLARGPVAILLEGEPGIGKTTLWRSACARVEGRAFTLLSCRPVEAEAKLAFASLADLLEPVAQAILPGLPEPQRAALEVALMSASPIGAEPSPRAVATALLSTLRSLAAGTPVVVAIDDAQWLDRASAAALAFALRRIRDDRVGVAVALRVEDGRIRDPLRLEEAFPGRCRQLRIGPLSLSALHHVIRGHLGHTFPRPALRRIADASGGNPFFALELARALIEAGAQPGPGDPLPVPDTLASLVLRRLGRLPATARRVLLAVAASPAPTRDLVCLAAGTGSRAAGALQRAEQARILETRGQRVRFAHPLIASTVYSSGPAKARREIHAGWAGVVSEPEERARHLALAAAAPDAVVARSLEEAAVLARRRGAPDVAGDLLEQAARLTPEGDAVAAQRRRIRAAEQVLLSGDRARARALVEGVLAESVVSAERSAALHVLGRIEGFESSFAAAVSHLEEALQCAEDASPRVAIGLDLAFATFSAGDLGRAIDVSTHALAEAEALGTPGLIAEALAAEVLGRFFAGRGSDRPALARALALEDRRRAGQLLLRPTSMAGELAVYEGRLAEAEALLREICSWAIERGEESELPFLLFHRSRLEWWRSDFPAAALYADEALLLAAQAGSEMLRGIALAHRGAARAGGGDVPRARADLVESRAILLEKTDYRHGAIWSLAYEGELELSLGDAAAAERALAPLITGIEAMGVGEPTFSFFASDAVEALIGIGQSARAARLLEGFSRQARALERGWAIAASTRCESLLASARGDLDAAAAAAEQAVERWRGLEMPVELGRTLLALGRVRRRRGERRLAAEAIEAALAIFRARGARLWAERAAEELRRIPLRRGAAGPDLTPTELKVAELAAAGQTNREVAQALFMSSKTVEANLTRIYGKLGIRSRAELGARMARRREGQAIN